MPKSPQYLRVLAFNDRGREMLGLIKKQASLPIITKYSEAKAEGGEILKLFEQESHFTDLYNLGFATPRPCDEEKTKQLFRL